MATEYKLSYTGAEINKKLGKVDELAEAVANEIATRQENDAVLSSRMDTFTALGEGSTTGDAELADIRVGADGTTYSTAGEAVREQVSKLSEEISNVKGDLAELYDIERYSFEGTGDMYADLDLKSGMKISITNRTTANATFNTSSTAGSFTLVETLGDVAPNETKVFEISLDARYVLIYSRSAGDIEIENISLKIPVLEKEVQNLSQNLSELKDELYVFSIDITYGQYIAPDGHSALNDAYSTMKIDVSKFRGLKVKAHTSVGGSATYSFWNSINKPVLISNETARGDYENVDYELIVPYDAQYLVVSCVTINKDVFYCRLINAVEALNNRIDNGLDVYAFTKGVCIGDSLTQGIFNVNGSSGQQITVQGKNYPSYFEKMTCIPMTNLGDAGKSTVQWLTAHGDYEYAGHDFAIIALGVNDPFRGESVQDGINAMKTIVNKIKSDVKGIKVFICTITPAYCYVGNGNYQHYSDFNALLKTNFSNEENCYIIDLFNLSDIKQNTPYVQGHFTALGYKKCAEEKIKFISDIMKSRPDEFKNIQFIGTDFSY